MKRSFFLIPGLLVVSALQAQMKEGTVVYERKINMHRNITDEQMKAMIPEFRTSKHLLIFSDSTSLYKTLPEDEAPDPFAGSNGPRIIMRGSPADAGEVYKNFAQSKSVLSSELAGRNYLIVDTIKQQPWKLGNETKQVLGHLCHKATRSITQAAGGIRMMTFNSGSTARRDSTQPQSKEVEVVAWYADDIISPVGPDSYGQLPGLILAIDVDNGATVFNALEVKTAVDTRQLKEPKKGKIVTRAEYQKLMMDMMGTQMQGGGNGIVRFRTN